MEDMLRACALQDKIGWELGQEITIYRILLQQQLPS
jgi:hypothetical protein